MKNSTSIHLLLALAASLTVATKGRAEDHAPAGSVHVQSTFIVPVTSRDGRDPFFPESTRVAEVPTTATRTVEISSLKVPGIFGAPGHLLAIINNHTFAAGDEGDVKAAAGTVHIRCLEISADHVLVEMNGQTHRINLKAK